MSASIFLSLLYSSRSEDSLSLVDCLQITFCPSNRHHLLLLYPREILVIDTEIMQAVGSVFLERNYSPFLQFVPCWQRDAIFCLHENGGISFRVRQHVEFPSSSPLTQADFLERREVVYNLYCHSEPLRISKSCHAYALTVCPTTELQTALLTSEGKVMFWKVQFEQVGLWGESEHKETLRDPLTLIGALPVEVGVHQGGGGGEEGALTLHHSIAPHWFTPPGGDAILDVGSWTHSVTFIALVLITVSVSL